MTQLPLTGAGPSAAGYIAKVKSYNPIAYWPLNETTGSTAICQINTAQNGTYTGVTLGQSVTDASGVTFVCPLFDGTNDYLNSYTTTFRDNFNGAEGTWMTWARVFNSGVWTDGNRHCMSYFEADGENYIFIEKTATNGRVELNYEAGDVKDRGRHNGISSTDWINFAMTWSATGDETRSYYSGGNEITATVLGTWVGNLANVVIGAQTIAPLRPWYGWLAHCAVWDTPLTATQIADLAVT